MKHFTPPRIVVVGFLAAILIGVVLLSLPIAVNGGERIGLIDALFTATSAVCVTGLIVKDTGIYFSAFGKAVIFGLIQMGGLGIMTVSTLFAILLGRKLTLKENVVIQTALDHHKIEGLVSLVKYIVLMTVVIELIGAGLLSFWWWKVYGLEPSAAVYNGIFHSVSAFCNAGFSLFEGSFTDFRGDIFINAVITSLVVIGGLGFLVLLDIPRFFKRGLIRVTLQTRIVLITTAALLILGTGCLFFFEANNAFSAFSFKERILSSYFHSVTARTAGFSTMDIGSMTWAGMLFLIFLMFIGGSPGSTAGGIKTTTFMVFIAYLRAMFHNREDATLFRRRIPQTLIRKVMLIISMGTGWIFVTALLLCFFESGNSQSSFTFLNLLFEAFSAFGTVGLSTGITPLLTPLSRILIIMTMFMGKIGILTFALAIALKSEPLAIRYPTEKVMVG